MLLTALHVYAKYAYDDAVTLTDVVLRAINMDRDSGIPGIF